MENTKKEEESSMTMNEYPPAPRLTSAERAYLRSVASGLSPIIQIGKGGLVDNLLITVSDALEAREMIKISVLDNADLTAREAADTLSEQLHATVVAVIGRKVVLYRRSLHGKRHIETKKPLES